MSFRQFTEYLTTQDRSPVTIRGYLADLEKFARWFEQTNGEMLTPQNLTAADLREYRQYLLTVQRAKPATINRALSAVRAYAAWAHTEGIIPANPVANIRGEKTGKPRPRWLTKQEEFRVQRELEKAVSAANTEQRRLRAIRDRSIVTLLLHTGLRVSELCALDLPDLTLTERKGDLHVRQGKGMKARIIPLNRVARNALRQWLSVRPAVDADAVFVNLRGGMGRMKPRSVQDLLAVVSRRIGAKVTPHILRHTFAKRLVDAGVSLEKVAELLGHESIETTRVYITPSQQDLLNAVETLA